VVVRSGDAFYSTRGLSGEPECGGRVTAAEIVTEYFRKARMTVLELVVEYVDMIRSTYSN